ncbi:hypothetical protein F4553_002097 [Allocatelliglobosispora scoriae]|uniref:Mycothiol-dependent maleylpyruvate isomerase metal-binding domain-containing protein n=1 Tax=Allocatelliglobosispora scoriae TaxID=643052 RepID=A0A841BMW2_9ACTN|nr:hypothetical protein [Allocatelliglobosispora scoriae]MBB5868718.1 hypothetical protein [Allocatelliglobosispora scoriae]
MRTPVTADDVDLAVSSAVSLLRPALHLDWRVPAGGLTWSCWETLEHAADDLFAYALQLGPKQPPTDAYVPVVCLPARDGGPRSSIFVEAASGNAGVLQVLEGCAALLVGVVTITPSEVRAFHGLGVSDPEGFAAMGIVEVLAHTHDVASGLGLSFVPPADLCDRVLRRLFPDAPTETERWPTLLWATGRGELPGRPALTEWRWDVTPR